MPGQYRTPSRSTWDPQLIEQQRKPLEALRRQLLGGEDKAAAKEPAEQEPYGGETEEFEDEAQDMAQHEINQALHDVNDRRVSIIERVPQKIADGTCGLSDASGQPTPRARLEATPEATLAVREERRREAGG